MKKYTFFIYLETDAALCRSFDDFALRPFSTMNTVRVANYWGKGSPDYVGRKGTRGN